MNFKAVGNTLGKLLTYLSTLMIFPLLFAYYYNYKKYFLLKTPLAIKKVILLPLLAGYLFQRLVPFPFSLPRLYLTFLTHILNVCPDIRQQVLRCLLISNPILFPFYFGEMRSNG